MLNARVFRFKRTVAAFVLFPACLLALAGCATITPPARVADPVPIYLARYMVHSSVLLPRDGTYVEYTFGDWNYVALHHKFINDAVGALTVSGCSAFERRIITVDPQTGTPLTNDHPDSLVCLYADRDAVEKRLADLDGRFAHDVLIHKDDGLMVNADQSVAYVKDPEHYSVADNCNHLTAETLRAWVFAWTG